MKYFNQSNDLRRRILVPLTRSTGYPLTMSTSKSSTKPSKEAYVIEVAPEKVKKMSKDKVKIGQDLYEQFAKEGQQPSLTAEEFDEKIRPAREAALRTAQEIEKALRHK
jgi:hypothetical protein